MSHRAQPFVHRLCHSDAQAEESGFYYLAVFISLQIYLSRFLVALGMTVRRIALHSTPIKNKPVLDFGQAYFFFRFVSEPLKSFL